MDKRGRNRDRRGRGLRSELLPGSIPGHSTRSEDFDALVLEAYAEIHSMWHSKLRDIDIAVDDVPGILPRDSSPILWPSEIVADGPIALARLIPAGLDRRGNTTRARLVLFRRPLELRAKGPGELIDLVAEVLTTQVAEYLGASEEQILRGPD